MGRYVFSMKNELDQVECVINTPGEWNIPLISITAGVGSRYRISDTLKMGIYDKNFIHGNICRSTHGRIGNDAPVKEAGLS